MTELSHLPPEIRARKYLELAGDARREASKSNGAVRESYLLIARAWDRLSAEAEALTKGPAIRAAELPDGARNDED